MILIKDNNYTNIISQRNQQKYSLLLALCMKKQALPFIAQELKSNCENIWKNILSAW